MACLTADTSPRMMIVTSRPPSFFSHVASSTSAVLHMISMATTAAVTLGISKNPYALPMRLLLYCDLKTFLIHSGLDGRKDLLYVIVRSREHVCSYKLAQSSCSVSACLYCCLDSSYISAHHNCYESASDLLCSYQCYLSCLCHCIRSLDRCCKSSCFNHS